MTQISICLVIGPIHILEIDEHFVLWTIFSRFMHSAGPGSDESSIGE